MFTATSYVADYLAKTPVENRVPGFVEWIQTIETIVHQNLDVGLLDLPDEDYMIEYQYGLDAKKWHNASFKTIYSKNFTKIKN